MKVILHKRFYEAYTGDPAAAPGRIEAIVQELRGTFDFIEPALPREGPGKGPRSKPHPVRKAGRSGLRDGSPGCRRAIRAAETAFEGEPAFGLIRPPGHHASPHSCWGFCYFNNIAIALKKLMAEGKIRKPHPRL